MTEKNHLSKESSPYLLQHADNPVEWYPWGNEALNKAREENKPILLSIGYSACHWCHVMAHESFEDERTAKLMNELYVNIKVDREERPDIDQIYQITHQLLTRRAGGWPLTMFINPVDQRPFFGGTYFPPESRHGLPAFPKLLAQVSEFFNNQTEEVKKQGKQLAEVLRKLEPEKGDHQLTDEPLVAARQMIGKKFDGESGGIGHAPKFPHPATLDRLLRHWRANAQCDEPDLNALYMVSLTLTKMAEGGIYDQLGGGFCRYSVDQHWQIPHFEKMLYDNGPLLALYAHAFQATGEELFFNVAHATANWMLRDMQAPDGGFYSTLDADSEGAEGTYYLWTPEEVTELLNKKQYALVSRHLGLTGTPNFEGKWHLTIREPRKLIAKDLEIAETLVDDILDEANAILLDARYRRIAPDRDDKQLTSWNALAIRGLAIAGSILKRPDLIDAAEHGVNFIKQNLIKDGRLLASYKDGKAKLPAYLDDYAFLLDALIELLQARWDTKNLETAIQLADTMLTHFYDDADGGFFFTADDHEKLMHRPKPLSDDSMPSGNGIAALALQRLGFLLGDSRFLDAAEKTLKYAWPQMMSHPHGHVSLISALEEYIEHPEIIIIRTSGEQSHNWHSEVRKLYAPRRLVFDIPENIDGLPGALATKKAHAGKTIAYRCLGHHCSQPIATWEELAEKITDKSIKT
ncbi:MAG: thioredoxin domain-containing protein [Woeseia sp.]|nr:thioredoxin domain-containing protein [Woeseia sp.]|tara:strand:- start:3851 stop:5923 length:2073 start_codon:yes stop_codon:yes gene_type:complete